MSIRPSPSRLRSRSIRRLEYEKRSKVSASYTLERLIETTDLDSVPRPRIGFPAFTEADFRYQSFGMSYILDFSAPRWVQCAYNPPWVEDEDGDDADGESLGGSVAVVARVWAGLRTTMYWPGIASSTVTTPVKSSASEQSKPAPVSGGVPGSPGFGKFEHATEVMAVQTIEMANALMSSSVCRSR